MNEQFDPTLTPTTAPPSVTLVDRLGRPLRDLRISVTDRCNFRCRYCMPREVFGPDFAFLPRSEILSFEEIARLARVVRGARRAQDPPHRRRADAARGAADAGRDAGGDPRPRHRDDDERLAAVAAGAGRWRTRG